MSIGCLSSGSARLLGLSKIGCFAKGTVVQNLAENVGASWGSGCQSMYLALLGYVFKKRLPLYSLGNLLKHCSGKMLLRQKMTIKHLLTYAMSTIIVRFNKQLLIICFVFLFTHLGVRQRAFSFTEKVS